MAHRKTIEAGTVFGRLTVIGVGQSGYLNRSQSKCVCECGVTGEFDNNRLRRGKVRSCGCITPEPKHGRSGDPIHKVWGAVIQRCTNPKSTSYNRYGERGVTICDAWRDFAVFLADMGDRPSDNHSIDRIDNDGNYSCGKCGDCIQNGWSLNCRWATPEEQANNKRSNLVVTVDGKSMTAAQWEKVTGVSQKKIRQRIFRGWSDKEAVCGRLATSVEH